MTTRKRSLLQAYTGVLPDSALRYTIEAFIPYTNANLNLAFKPNVFFNDLERIGRYSRSSVERAYCKAKKLGYIELTYNTPILTDKGAQALKPYNPVVMERALLLVIFDIPEHHKYQRDRFRRLLRELKFSQVQKSVWSSKYDSREIIRQAIHDLDIGKFTEFFEAAHID